MDPQPSCIDPITLLPLPLSLTSLSVPTVQLALSPVTLLAEVCGGSKGGRIHLYRCRGGSVRRSPLPISTPSPPSPTPSGQGFYRLNTSQSSTPPSSLQASAFAALGLNLQLYLQVSEDGGEPGVNGVGNKRDRGAQPAAVLAGGRRGWYRVNGGGALSGASSRHLHAYITEGGVGGDWGKGRGEWWAVCGRKEHRNCTCVFQS